MSALAYLARIDDNGVLLVERYAGSGEKMFTIDDVAQSAKDYYPEVIYFEVEPPANHVNYYTSQDVAHGDDFRVLSTWSVYREEYAPSDLDNPLDDLTFVVATLRTQEAADELAEYLYTMNVKSA